MYSRRSESGVALPRPDSRNNWAGKLSGPLTRLAGSGRSSGEQLTGTTADRQARIDAASVEEADARSPSAKIAWAASRKPLRTSRRRRPREDRDARVRRRGASPLPCESLRLDLGLERKRARDHPQDVGRRAPLPGSWPRPGCDGPRHRPPPRWRTLLRRVTGPRPVPIVVVHLDQDVAGEDADDRVARDAPGRSGATPVSTRIDRRESDRRLERGSSRRRPPGVINPGAGPSRRRRRTRVERRGAVDSPCRWVRSGCRRAVGADARARTPPTRAGQA